MIAATWPPGASIAALRQRAELNTLIRQFFAERSVLEVETPLLSACATVDRHIESFSVDGPGSLGAEAPRRWLRTSPEFAMKRLLCAGVGDCYELGRVFRRGEAGARHNPEFSLLEWYRVGFSLDALMDEVSALIAAALALVGRRCRVRRCSYRQLFQDAFGLDPHVADVATLRAAAGDLRIDPEGLERDDWLDLLISHRLQPGWAADTLLLLHDYPASQSALAHVHEVDGQRVAERFEAYLGPLELANGYHELADADEQQRRFESEQAWRRAQGRSVPPYDLHLVNALRAGLPDCSGVALGVDRLLACLLDSPALSAVIAFDFARA